MRRFLFAAIMFAALAEDSGGGGFDAGVAYAPDEDTVNAWKNSCGDVFQVTVKGDKRDYNAYFKKPSRKIIQACMSIGATDPIKMNETLMENCWLGGDAEIKTDDSLFLSACAKLGELFQIKEAEIKKL